MKINARNERLKRGFFRWMKNAAGCCDSTVNAAEKSILLYQEFTGNEDLGLYGPDKAIEFKKWLGKRTFRDRPISPVTYHGYLKGLKKFFGWLCWEPGYKKRINPSVVEYLKPTDKEDRMAAQAVPRNYPSLEYVVKLAGSIEVKTEVDQRDRALVSFALISGMRDNAIVSLPLGCVDESALVVLQNPLKGVGTKFSKLIPTTIFPFDQGLMENVLAWIKHLKDKGFGSQDPLFPRSKMDQGKDGMSFEVSSTVEPVFWRGTGRVREIFKKRSHAVGLPYFPPHTFRHLAVDLALKSCRNGEEIKAISQNFGHEHVATTMSAYANYPPDRLSQIIKGMGFGNKVKEGDADTLEKFKKLILR